MKNLSSSVYGGDRVRLSDVPEHLASALYPDLPPSTSRLIVDLKKAPKVISVSLRQSEPDPLFDEMPNGFCRLGTRKTSIATTRTTSRLTKTIEIRNHRKPKASLKQSAKNIGSSKSAIPLEDPVEIHREKWRPYVRVSDKNLKPLNERDWAALSSVWPDRPSLPMSVTDWEPYIKTYLEIPNPVKVADCDDPEDDSDLNTSGTPASRWKNKWDLCMNFVDPIQERLNNRSEAVEEFRLRLPEAIRQGEIVPKSPITLLPVSLSQTQQIDDCFVDAAALKQYADSLSQAIKLQGSEWIPAETSEEEDSSPTPFAVTTPSGLGRREILAADWPLYGRFTQDSLSRALSDVPAWLKPARVLAGAPGRGSSLWNPAKIAHALLTCQKANKASLSKFIERHFGDWRDKWDDLSEDQ